MQPYSTAVPFAKGATSEVFRATDPDSGRAIAIKILKGSDPALKQRFRREVETLEKLDHPGIARLVDHGEMEGRPFLAMEFIDGLPFDRALAGQPVDVVVATFLKVVDALAHAHDSGVLHRDLKPANILVRRRSDGEFEPVLVDFGLVRDEAAQSRTETGVLLGTPAFMAPEQARGDRVAIDRRTDVYGLGAVLYLALTGRPPYDGDSTGDVIAAVLAGPPRPPGGDVPRALAAILDRALARSPERRYRGAREFSADLEAWLAGGSVRALRGYRRRQVRAAIGRHPWRTAVGAMLLILLAALSAQQAWLHQRESESREQALRIVDQLAEARAQMRQRFLAPQHDIGDELARVDRQVRNLADRAELGPGRDLPTLHYAIGRVLLDLGRNEEALDRLVLAQRAGCTSADCASALATAHLALYRRDLEREFEQFGEVPSAPVRRHLDAARDVLLTVPETDRERIELAAVVRPLDEIEHDAEQRLAERPWAFESAQALARARYRAGLEAMRVDELDRAVGRFRGALDAFGAAAVIARSYPEAYLGTCRALARLTESAMLGAEVELAEFDPAFDRCQQAARVDSARAEAYTLPAGILERRAMQAYEQGDAEAAAAAIRAALGLLAGAPQAVRSSATFSIARARALTTSARAETLVGQSAIERLRLAVEVANEATERAPGSLSAWRTWIHAVGSLGNADPGFAARYAEQAAAIAREISRRWPEDRSARNALGTMLLHVAYQRRLAGEPDEALLQRSIDILQSLVEDAPDYTRARNNLGLAWWDMLLLDLDAGRSPAASEAAARTAFESILARNPVYPSAMVNLSGIHLTIAEHRINVGAPVGDRIERSLALLERLQASGEYLPCDFALAWYLRSRVGTGRVAERARSLAIDHAGEGDTGDCRRVRRSLGDGMASADRT